VTGHATNAAAYRSVLHRVVHDELSLPVAAGLSIAQCADEALALFKELAAQPVLKGVYG
jgi:hypothetical protein